MKHPERVWAEVDLDAILQNIRNLKKNVKADTKIMGIIKTDGYGHGATKIAEILEPEEYIFGYGVATAEEAISLRNDGIKKAILILGYTFPSCYEELIENEVRPATFTEEMLEDLNAAAGKVGKKCIIHIKVDTGMSRIGIRPDDSGLAFVKKAFSYPDIEVEGIFTHFAKADELNKASVKKQFEIFSQFLKRIKEELHLHIPVKHCSNSASIVELPEANLDLVRSGITTYGLWPSDEVKQDIVKLTPALTLKSRIVFVKTLEAGREISYGGTYVTKKATQVATVCIGYGDGYPRSLSNKGYVLLHGQKAPILGRVCMDQMMIDITDIQGETKVGDVVTLIGKDGLEEITMEQLGNMANRFNYELACDLGKRIPRIYRWQNQLQED